MLLRILLGRGFELRRELQQLRRKLQLVFEFELQFVFQFQLQRLTARTARRRSRK
ncbi:hypothetical protein [Streptomyces sp. WAC08241]|uniref:hypothetical protein n=1 Tax=Streptomyces sp. WAC08241 TaxID=2487421 RepID=UPI00163BF4BF|nr:hypothetical protein [Streptomyces sp. WAC08241]